MYIEEIGLQGVDWIYLFHDRNRGALYSIMNVQVLSNALYVFE